METAIGNFLAVETLGGATKVNRKAILQNELGALGKRVRFWYGTYLVGLAILFCIQVYCMFANLLDAQTLRTLVAVTGISTTGLLVLISKTLKQLTTVSLILTLSTAMEEKGLENILKILYRKT